jgi:hypothetical protein
MTFSCACKPCREWKAQCNKLPFTVFGKGERLTVDKPRVVITKEISLGTLIHLAGLVVAVAIAWGTFRAQVSELATSVSSIRSQTTRIEHYLNSQDQNYWKTTHENGDN